LECLIGAFVEFDSGVVNGCEPLISFLAALHHPLFEFISDEGVDDVADIVPWHLANLAEDGESINDVLVTEAEVEDIIKGELIILRNSNDLDVFITNLL